MTKRRYLLLCVSMMLAGCANHVEPANKVAGSTIVFSVQGGFAGRHSTTAIVGPSATLEPAGVEVVHVSADVMQQLVAVVHDAGPAAAKSTADANAADAYEVSIHVDHPLLDFRSRSTSLENCPLKQLGDQIVERARLGGTTSQK